MSVDALLAVAVRSLDDDGLRVFLHEIVAARARLAAAEAAAICEFDDRGLYLVDGALNAASWLAHQTGESRRIAGSRVLHAKRLRRMPLVRDALAAGTIGESQARVLDRCVTPRTVEAFTRDEAMLVEVAQSLEADDLGTAVSVWLAVNDDNGPDPGKERPSELRLSDLLDGRGRLDGELTWEDKVEVRAELDAIYDELWRQDQRADESDPDKDRSPAQRRAAALVEMARRSSAAGDRDDDTDDDELEFEPVDTPEPVRERSRPRRPQLWCIVDLPLGDDEACIARLDDGSLVPQGVLERWACDSTWGRVIMKPKSLPIDVSRISYTPSAGQRRALVARDRGCFVPGCKRKPRWCEAHHVIPWPHGPTSLDNLVLLCGRHHKQVHNHNIELIPGTAPQIWTVVRAADGTPIYTRPPPPRMAA